MVPDGAELLRSPTPSYGWLNTMSKLMPVAADTAQNSNTTGTQDVVVVLATQAGLVAASIAIQSLLAYVLLPQGRGAYALCIMFGGLFGILFTPGADRGSQYFVMTKQMSVSQGVSLSLIICLTGTGLALVLATPLIHSDLAFFQKAAPNSFYLALVLVPLTTFSTAVQLQLAGLRRFARLALFSLFQAVANVFAMTVLVWGLGLGIDGAIVSLATGHLVIIAACLQDLRRHCGLALELPFRSGLTRVLGYGLRYYSARVGHAVDPKVGVLFLGLVASRSETGLFALASALMLQFFMFSNAVSTSLLPRVAGDENGRPELVAFCARISCWATGAALAALLVVSTPLIRILFSDAFLPVVPLIWIIAPGIFVYAGTHVFTMYFVGVNRPEVCSWTIWIGLSTQLVVLVLLYPQLGIKAAALAMTIGMLCRSVFLVILYRRTTRMSLFSTWLPQRGDIGVIWTSSRSLISRMFGTRSVDA